MTMLRTLTIIAVLAMGLMPFSSPADAHSQSYGYLAITPGDNSVSGSLDIAVRDIDVLFDLDGDGDGQIIWREFAAREPEVTSALLREIEIGNGSAACQLTARPALVDRRGGESYIAIPFSGPCPALAGRMTVDYRVMFAADAQHRGLVAVHGSEATLSLVMTPESTQARVDLDDGTTTGFFLSYVAHGAHHILIGYDHILFLITLLLGTIVQAKGTGWRKAFGQSVKVVSAFTLSHSLTLGLAVTGVLAIPAALAEGLIAVTIVAAAVNNIRPLLTRRIWLVALVFGLIHGVGFANVLSDLGLPQGSLLTALLAFNIGVEAGQLAIVAAVLPVLIFAASRVAEGPRGIGANALNTANAAIAAVGAMWFSDRVFETALMPF
jgi:HupE / UreJ protein